GRYRSVGDFSDVAYFKDHLLIANRAGPCEWIDISTPASPRRVSLYSGARQSWAVASAGRYGFIADQVSGLQVVDLHDATTPRLIGQSSAVGACLNVRVTGGRVFAATADNCFLCFNTPSEPIEFVAPIRWENGQFGAWLRATPEMPLTIF